MSTSNDPLDILVSGTHPVSTAIDLTNHPTVLAAIDASYRQEDQIAAAKVVVGIVSRALQMVPVWGPALGNVLTGAQDQNALVAQIQQQLAAQRAAQPSGASCLQNFLQSPAVQSAVTALAGNPALPGLLAALQG